MAKTGHWCDLTNSMVNNRKAAVAVVLGLSKAIGGEREGTTVAPLFQEQNRMHKRVICVLEIVAHISRQMSKVSLKCLLHSRTIINI